MVVVVVLTLGVTGAKVGCGSVADGVKDAGGILGGVRGMLGASENVAGGILGAGNGSCIPPLWSIDKASVVLLLGANGLSFMLDGWGICVDVDLKPKKRSDQVEDDPGVSDLVNNPGKTGSFVL